MKTLRVATSVGVLMSLTGAAMAAGPDYLSQGRAVSREARAHGRSNGVVANGRCGAMSFGTGARRCGTASGGPVDGNNSRN